MTKPQKARGPGVTRGAPLAAARFGLASSNPGAEDAVLLRNALLQGRFDAILEAAAHDGLPFVAIPLIVTDDSGIVTGRSGDRDRRHGPVKHSAL